MKTRRAKLSDEERLAREWAKAIERAKRSMRAFDKLPKHKRKALWGIDYYQAERALMARRMEGKRR